jgi:hypothetical protein
MGIISLMDQRAARFDVMLSLNAVSNQLSGVV